MSLTRKSTAAMIFCDSRINSNQYYCSLLSERIHPMVAEMSPQRNAIFQGHVVQIHTSDFVIE